MLSYLHSSWESRRGMDKFIPTGTTYKSKVRRYAQSQQAMFGLKWKRIVDKQRTEIHWKINLHGSHVWDDTTEYVHATTEEEDFFPSE